MSVQHKDWYTSTDVGVRIENSNGPVVTADEVAVEITGTQAHKSFKSLTDALEEKLDVGAAVTSVEYDGTAKKIVAYKGTTPADVVTVATIKTDLNLAKGDVGLGDVDNTSDANKPISSATQTALDAKVAQTAFDGHVNDTDNPHQVTAAQVGLGNVDNTPDTEKDVNSAVKDGDGNVITETYETIAQAGASHTTLQGNIDAVSAIVQNLTGLEGTNFGGFSLDAVEATAISNIATIYTNAGYTSGDLYWFLAGTDMSVLRAYKYDGTGSPTAISSTVYDFTDFSGIQTKLANYKGTVSDLDALHNSTDIGIYFYSSGDKNGLVSVGYSTTDGIVTQHWLSDGVPDASDVTIFTAGPALLMRTYSNSTWSAWQNPIAKNAADIAALGPKLGEPSVIPVIETGKYINLSGGVGSTVSMTPSASGSGFCYRMADVAEGDIVSVSGTGGSTPRLWGFIDSENKLLSVANSDTTATDLRLTAPSDAAKVIINDRTNKESYVTKVSQKVVVRTSDIVNDLTTGGTGSVLSAEMGKTLNNSIAQAGTELKRSLLESSSTNLYNKDDEDCVAGYFIDKNNGNLGQSLTGVLKASGWIAVNPMAYYIGTRTNQFAWYNANKVYISGGINLQSAVQSPANAAYIRVSFYIEDDSTNRLNEGQTLLPYEDYSEEEVLKPSLITNKQDLLVSGTNIKTIAGQSILGSGNVLVNGSGVGVDGTNFKVLPSSSSNAQTAISDIDSIFDNILEREAPVNLYNKSDSDCVDGYYIDKNNGELAQSAGSLKASGWIAVKPSTYYIGWRTNQAAWYDINKTYISGVTNINTAAQSPSNAAYIRVSFYKADDDTNRMNEGQTLLPYEDYKAESTYKLKEEQITQYIPEIDDNKVNVGYNLAGTVRFINKVASLANGESLAINTSPADATCNVISLYANVTSFGNGLLVGKGPTTGIYCAWISVDSTSVKCYYQEGGNVVTQVGNDVAHGLTISGFIKVTIITKCNKWEVYVSTLANGETAKGVFYAEFNNAFKRGDAFVESIGASLTDVELMHNCNDVRKPIWAFGDSYFGSRTPSRVMYWMNQWGFADKMMVNGFGGRGSTAALQDLQKCLAVGTPKIIVWCLGMNDNQQTIELWQSCVESIKSLCDEKGIELVVATIPPVLSPNCVNKTAMNQYLIANNYRLLDVAKAVGADADGHWYGYGTAQDYQSSDTIHPSEYGAKAIAAQWLVDVPEITQYQV